MRWLVCGGRDFGEKFGETTFAYNMLDSLKYIYCGEESFPSIIQGGAKGADYVAKAWAILRQFSYIEFPADWKKYGKSAGYIRNKQMLEEGKPDLVIAFPGDKGTAMMVDLARKVGVEVIVVPKMTP
jgi:hypothetical protein